MPRGKEAAVAAGKRKRIRPSADEYDVANVNVVSCLNSIMQACDIVDEHVQQYVSSEKKLKRSPWLGKATRADDRFDLKLKPTLKGYPSRSLWILKGSPACETCGGSCEQDCTFPSSDDEDAN